MVVEIIYKLTADQNEAETMAVRKLDSVHLQSHRGGGQTGIKSSWEFDSEPGYTYGHFHLKTLPWFLTLIKPPDPNCTAH